MTSGTPITSRSDISGGTTEQTAEAEAADGSVTTVESSDATAETTTTADNVSPLPMLQFF